MKPNLPRMELVDNLVEGFNDNLQTNLPAGAESFESFVVDSPLRYMVLLRRELMSQLGMTKAEATDDAVFSHDLTALCVMSPVVRSEDGREARVIMGYVNPSMIVKVGYVPRRDRQQG